MTGHMKGKDLTTPILKEIAQRHNTKAPVSPVKLQHTFKTFLFAYHGNMVSYDKSSWVEPDLLKAIIHNWDMPSTKWPVVLFSDKSFTKIQWELSSVMKTIEKHKKLVAEAIVVGKKTKSQV